MGESEIARRRNSPVASGPPGVRLLIILFLSLGTVASSPQPSSSQGASNLASVEQKLFFKTYADESDEARVNRIETQLFGQPMPGGLADRMARIMGAASPQINPDGSVSGLGTQQSSGTTSDTRPPSEADLKARAEEERQAAIERAKVAVMAAREEQTNKLLETGVTLWRSKRGSEALSYFEQALKVDPHNASALYYAGIVYESKKNYVEALAAYRKASNEDPGNREYYDAVTAVQKLMNNRPPVDPKQAQIRELATEAGDAYKRGEYLSALDLYKQLDQKAPNQALVKYNLGMLYLQAHHFRDALDSFQLAVQLRPTDQKFVQAYQQLKANLDKSEAAQKESEAAWGGNTNIPGGANRANNGMGMSGGMSNAMSGGMGMSGGTANGMSGGMGMPGGTSNGYSQGQAPAAQGLGRASYGHPAMNMAAQGTKNNDPFSPQTSPQISAQTSQNGGSQQVGFGQTNQGGGASTAANPPQNAVSVASATPPGTGHEPGFAPSDSSNSLNRWAQVQNSAKAVPPKAGGSSDSSDIPPGQHPLIRHPLKYSSGSTNKPQTNAPARAPQTPFQPEKNVVFTTLQQPAANAISELGIVAANTKSGVMISHVGIASRASKAGLLKGDLIRAVDNKVVTSLAQVMAIVSKKAPGAPIDMHIQRKDQMGVVHL